MKTECVVSVKSLINNREEHLTGLRFPGPKGDKEPNYIMNVFVINLDNTPLMPTTPCKARKLLQSGKAVVVRRRPFTIRLNWLCENNIQPVTVGIDKGSHLTGFCATSNGKILITGTINHRTNIKEKMDDRRAHRKSRRILCWLAIKRSRISARPVRIVGIV